MMEDVSTLKFIASGAVTLEDVAERLETTARQMRHYADMGVTLAHEVDGAWLHLTVEDDDVGRALGFEEPEDWDDEEDEDDQTPLVEGERVVMLSRLARHAHQEGAPAEEVLIGLRKLNAAHCVPPVDDDTLLAIVAWAPLQNR